MRNAIQRFMYGRYGSDQLGFFLIGASFFLALIAALTDMLVFQLVGDVVFVWSIFRIFSRNISKRREENSKFMRKAQPVLKWLRLQQTMHRDKEHRYFKCPNCSQYLRVPKGKGKITVTCRSCKASFQEKS